MKHDKFNYYEREKKIHRVQKSNKSVKHKNQIYVIDDYEPSEDLSDELHLDEVEQDHTTH